MEKCLAQEAFFAHLRCDCILETIISVDTHVQRACAVAVEKGEKAECVYLDNSIIICSNKHSALGGYRFVISKPDIFMPFEELFCQV